MKATVWIPVGLTPGTPLPPQHLLPPVGSRRRRQWLVPLGIHTPLHRQHLPSWGGFTRYFGRNGDLFTPPPKGEPLPVGNPAQPALQVLCFLTNTRSGNTVVRHPLRHSSVFVPIFLGQIFAKFTFLDGSTRPILPPQSCAQAPSTGLCTAPAQGSLQTKSHNYSFTHNRLVYVTTSQQTTCSGNKDCC